nr:Clp protease ATP binding subunit [Pseudo-nitzschia hainanensis]
MFERFTEGAIKVIMLSQEEARRMGHNFVGTEQLLLGVIGQRHGIGGRSLKKVKIGLKRVRREVELYIGRGTGFVASEIPFTPRAKRVLEMAVEEGRDFGHNFVGTEHILLALISEPDGVAMRTLNKLRVNIPQLKTIILDDIEKTAEEFLKPMSRSEKFLIERSKGKAMTPTLNKYAENLTEAANKGKLDPVIGRDSEINDVIAVLARRRKNNPVLIGEPGVGKTAIAEGLAQLIADGTAPKFLDSKIIMALDLSSILAGTKYRGEFEERLKQIVEEVQNNQNVIVVIDEIHTLVGAGAAEGAVDAANILKPALSRGKFCVLGATTIDEYRKYIERDPALERRFQPVNVPEPTVETTIEILYGLRSKFEEHHSLSFNDKALELSVILSKQFVTDRYLPDKAIDVMDEAAARVRLENRRLPNGMQMLLEELQDTLADKAKWIKLNRFEEAKESINHEMEVRGHIRVMKKAAEMQRKRGKWKYDTQRYDYDVVNEDDVSAVVSKWTGIPVNKVTDSESEKLMKMEEVLHKKLIGQEHAVSSVSRAIRRSRVGLRNMDRPIASFIFAGPTGVGKTELTKTLADYMFTSKDCFVRLDMSEYMEKHTVSKLIGSPPGYVGYNEGGILTEAVRRAPYSVVLLDEVEKAHGDVFNILLQILDDGRLSDSKGKIIDFTNTIIIMTTNLGARIIEAESGIQPKKDVDRKFSIGSRAGKYTFDWKPIPEKPIPAELLEKIKGLVHEELKNFFRPEFLNRVDEIIIFKHLSRMEVWQICKIMLDQIADTLLQKKIILEVKPEVHAFLADAGYDPQYGARPLRRAIMSYLEDTLSEVCLTQKLYENTRLIVSRNALEDKLEITINLDDVAPPLIELDKAKENGAPKKEIEAILAKLAAYQFNEERKNRALKAEAEKKKAAELKAQYEEKNKDAQLREESDEEKKRIERLRAKLVSPWRQRRKELDDELNRPLEQFAKDMLEQEKEEKEKEMLEKEKDNQIKDEKTIETNEQNNKIITPLRKLAKRIGWKTKRQPKGKFQERKDSDGNKDNKK